DPAESGWAVKKDQGQFDQFAGATITPRAVVKAVHQALRYFDAHQRELLSPGSTAVENSTGRNSNG
ncbi:MAG: FMN-binding protein, partial [Pseudomonas sp.]|nr:FMN-binding protein [Pseudomonas sp.]